jgi:hypothetical protein
MGDSILGSPGGNNAYSDLSPYRGAFGTKEIVHLLKRTMFSAKKSDADHFKNKPLSQVIDELLHPVEFSQPLPVNDFDPVGLYVPFGATWVGASYNNAEDDSYRIGSFRKWTMGVFINQDRSIREKMLLFWHNHFATQTDIGRCNLVWNHHQLLRTECLGNVKDLTRRITLDPHMLRYLNGEENTRLAPNENYARELQELFCIGKGPDAKFTESDVKKAAKVLTGWKVDLDKNTSYFKEDDHDSSDKSFSSFYGNAVIKGQSGPLAGERELSDLLDMIFSNRETAVFICRKLYRWFVYYNIDDVIEKNVINPLANLLVNNNFEIKPVLAALLGSNHFFDTANIGAQVKSPLDFCIGMQREFNIPYVLDKNPSINYSMLLFLVEYCSMMGQVYADPPNVSGWPAYYQVPSFYELWINTSTYPKRNEFSSTLIDYGYNREGRFFSADVIAFAQALPDPGNADLLISDSLDLLYSIPVSADSKNKLKKEALLSGQTQDHYWTDAWNDHIAEPSNPVLRSIVESRLKNLYRYIVNSPEYQLA